MPSCGAILCTSHAESAGHYSVLLLLQGPTLRLLLSTYNSLWLVFNILISDELGFRSQM